MGSYDPPRSVAARLLRPWRSLSLDTWQGRLALFWVLAFTQAPVVQAFLMFDFSFRQGLLIILGDLTFLSLVAFVVALSRFFSYRRGVRYLRLKLEQAQREREESYRALVAAGWSPDDPLPPTYTLNGGDR